MVHYRLLVRASIKPNRHAVGGVPEHGFRHRLATTPAALWHANLDQPRAVRPSARASGDEHPSRRRGRASKQAWKTPPATYWCESAH